MNAEQDCERLRLVRSCRLCGCTDGDACYDGRHPCRWVDLDLCSACAKDAAGGARRLVARLSRMLRKDIRIVAASGLVPQGGAKGSQRTMRIKRFEPGSEQRN